MLFINLTLLSGVLSFITGLIAFSFALSQFGKSYNSHWELVTHPFGLFHIAVFFYVLIPLLNYRRNLEERVMKGILLGIVYELISMLPYSLGGGMLLFAFIGSIIGAIAGATAGYIRRPTKK